jgi:hypothetical protein
MVKIKKYQDGTSETKGVPFSERFGKFMGEHGGKLTSAATALAPLLMKQPDPNERPYKKGTNLIKYQKGRDSVKAQEFSDPEVSEIVKYIQSEGNSVSEKLPPVDTIVGKRGNKVTPTIEDTNKKMLEDLGEIPAESKGYSGTQTGLMGGIAGVLKAMKMYKGRGKNLINPIGSAGSYFFPFGVPLVNIHTHTSEKAGETETNWKNTAIQTGADLLGVFAGRKLSRGMIRPIQEKLAQNKKLKEDVKEYKEKASKYPESLITWNKELEEAKKKDFSMPMAEKSKRMQEVNSGDRKYATEEAEVLSRKPKKPSAKNIDLPKPLMELYGESFKQEGRKLANTFGFSPLKNLSVKEEEEFVRRSKGKVKSLSDLERKIQRNEKNTNIGTGALLGGAALGSGALIKRAIDNKKEEKKKQKSNK